MPVRRDGSEALPLKGQKIMWDIRWRLLAMFCLQQETIKVKILPQLSPKVPLYNLSSRDEEGKVIKEVKGFYLASVYDVSQTEGEPIPKPIYELEENRKHPQKFDWYIQAITELSPVPIQFSEIEGTAKGFFVPTEKQITIRPGMSQSQTIKTMLMRSHIPSYMIMTSLFLVALNMHVKKLKPKVSPIWLLIH